VKIEADKLREMLAEQIKTGEADVAAAADDFARCAKSLTEDGSDSVGRYLFSSHPVPQLQADVAIVRIRDARRMLRTIAALELEAAGVKHPVSYE
jgi:hypothetical protein